MREKRLDRHDGQEDHLDADMLLPDNLRDAVFLDAQQPSER